MNSPKDYLTDKEPTREIEDWEKEFDDFADQNEDDDCGCENFYWYDSPRTVKKFIKALLTETIQQSMEVGRNEREKEIIKKIEKYFEGLILILNPQLAKDSLIKFLSPKP